MSSTDYLSPLVKWENVLPYFEVSLNRFFAVWTRDLFSPFLSLSFHLLCLPTKHIVLIYGFNEPLEICITFLFRAKNDGLDPVLCGFSAVRVVKNVRCLALCCYFIWTSKVWSWMNKKQWWGTGVRWMRWWEMVLGMISACKRTHASNAPIPSCKQYRLFTSREVRIGKNCARGLGYSRRPQAEDGTRDRGHSFPQFGPT